MEPYQTFTILKVLTFDKVFWLLTFILAISNVYMNISSSCRIFAMYLKKYNIYIKHVPNSENKSS